RFPRDLDRPSRLTMGVELQTARVAGRHSSSSTGDSFREDVPLRQGQSFRVLRWERSLARVDEVLEPRRRVPLAGQGDHWHFHRASELTFFERGAGTRFVADHIEHFESGDLVMLGSNVPHYWHVRGESKGAAIQWHFPAEHGIWEF